MFPKLICSMKNKAKQEELNTVYKDFVMQKKPAAEEQVTLENEFFECGTCIDYMMTLYRVVKSYIDKRTGQEDTPLFVDPSLIRQMIAMVERFTEDDILNLKCLMNF